jgi:tape measure domain-containing protein
MSNGSAEFEVKLVDKVTRPAQSASKAIDDLERKLSKGGGGVAERQTRQEQRTRAKGIADQERATARAEAMRAREAERAFQSAQREVRRGELLRARGLEKASRAEQRDALRTSRGLQRNELQNMRTRARMRAQDAREAAEGDKERIKAAEQFNDQSVSGAAVLAGAALAAAAAVGALAYQVESTAHDSAIFAQNTELAFQQLAKHGVDGGKLFEHVRAEAQEFGLEVQDTTKQYTKFLALQFSPKEADKLLAMGADLRALGNDAEGVSGIFTAIGQIKSKGKLQGEELMQLSERGVSSKLVQEAIGEKLGKTQAEVMKLQQAGKISSDVALPAIEMAINRKLQQKELGDTGKKFADTTIAGAEGKLKANWDNLWIGLGQRTEKSFGKLTGGLVGRLSAWVNSDDSTEFMDNWGARIDRLNQGIDNAVSLAQRLGAGFDQGSRDAEGITQLLDKLGGKGVNLDDAATKAERLGRAIGFITSTVMALGGAVESAGEAVWSGFIEPITSTVSEVSDALGRVSTIWDATSIGWISKAERIGEELLPSLGRGLLKTIFYPATIAKVSVDFVLELFNVKDRFYTAGANALEGFGEGMLRSLPLVGSSLGAALDLIKDKPKDELEMHSPSRLTDRYGGWYMDGFGGGIERRAPLVARAAGDAAKESTAAFHAGLGLDQGATFRLGGVAANTNTASPELSFSAPHSPDPNTQFQPGSFAPRGDGRMQLDLNLRVQVDGSAPLDVQLAEATVERLEPLLESIFERYLETG